jgi:glutamate:GABA antiporter
VTDLSASPVETTSLLAAGPRRRLRRCLRRFDMVLFTLCALISVDTLGQVASFGAATFTWIVILSLSFLLPYGLLIAEVGSAFTAEGGPYAWIKRSFGTFWGAIGAVFYWMTTPIWVGGSLAFIASAAWSAHIHHLGSGWTAGNLVFTLGFVWVTIIVAIVSLRYGKWIPNLGAIVRVGMLVLFSVTVVLFALKHGVHGFHAGSFSPFNIAVILGLAPVLLFNLVGFELQNGAAEEMVDAQRDVPASVLWSGVLTTVIYAVPVFGIVAVLPASKISGIGGFLDAVGATFSVYGSAGHLLTQVMTLGFIFAVMTAGAVWIMGSDRIMAVAAADGAFPGFFGQFHPTLGTPVRVNLLSGAIGTAFCLVAIQVLSGSAADTFLVVLTMATSLTLIGYLLIFPTVAVLRRQAPDVPRPYTVNGGRAGLWIATALCMFWVGLGSWVATFPGTLNHLLGEHYSIRAVFGVSTARFEALTLSTLAAVVLVAVAGYALAAPTRRQAALARATAEPRVTAPTGMTALGRSSAQG